MNHGTKAIEFPDLMVYLLPDANSLIKLLNTA